MRSPESKFSLTYAPALARVAGVASICLILIGCTPPPDLQGRVQPIDNTLPWPTLFTTAQLEQTVTPTLSEDKTSTEATDSLTARAAALRTRARGLSAPVLDSATRKHLLAAVARHP
ncbi:hypothetical protein [Pacificibacter marinus]|uniref:hypothetical protein n=1 Tax=Pacificibacter marinus TaxID=658057 RepID=UPI001C071696|nr:hypothetical protein [Pacificibacter marinus]MBU2867065.1 hypothetical protein [Pacificibacter marinus]